MTRNYAQQKAGLTRALRAGGIYVVEAECARVIAEWDGRWPDDWTRWQRALWDVGSYRDLDDIARDLEKLT